MLADPQLARRALGCAAGEILFDRLGRSQGGGLRFAADSPLEGAVRSEPVSEISPFRAILDGNKLILALKIAQNRKHGSRSA